MPLGPNYFDQRLEPMPAAEADPEPGKKKSGPWLKARSKKPKANDGGTQKDPAPTEDEGGTDDERAPAPMPDFESYFEEGDKSGKSDGGKDEDKTSGS